jgi:hypothetical protein
MFPVINIFTIRFPGQTQRFHPWNEVFQYQTTLQTCKVRALYGIVIRRLIVVLREAPLAAGAYAVGTVTEAGPVWDTLPYGFAYVVFPFCGTFLFRARPIGLVCNI